jgi:hypothetical protein
MKSIFGRGEVRMVEEWSVECGVRTVEEERGRGRGRGREKW